MTHDPKPALQGVLAVSAALAMLWSAHPAGQLSTLQGAPALDVEWAPRAHEDAPDRGGGPPIGDYTGMPINAAARLRAESWSASWLTLPEWQCRPHTAEYLWLGPGGLRLWREVNPSTRLQSAFRITYSRGLDRTIYMDGRPEPPPSAPHSWYGFSKGEWNGDIFSFTTTHLKEGFIKRNGVPLSERAVLRTHLIRNDNYLTVVSIAYDPAYLEEPLVRTTDFEQAPRQFQTAYPCAPSDEIPRPFGEVPHYLPGANPYLTEHLAGTNIPPLAWEGGAETIYPEFRDKIARGITERSMAPTPGAALNKVPPVVEPPGVNVSRVRDNVYLITGAGGNITASIGEDGVVLVDSGTAAKAADVLRALKTISALPVYWIVNTTHEADHTGGNDIISRAGTTYSPNGDAAGDPGARTLAHENVLARMSTPTGVAQKFPSSTWPKDAYVGDQTTLPRWFNGEGVRLVHPESAHTDGNSIVHFRKADVIAVGDIYRTDQYPILDLQNGGSINGLLKAINAVLQLSVTDFMLEGGTLIVPGHGRVSDASELTYYRDMVTIIRDRVQDLMNKGMTLQQVKAARPTRDFDPVYAGTSADSTADTFVEAVYRSLAPRGTR